MRLAIPVLILALSLEACSMFTLSAAVQPAYSSTIRTDISLTATMRAVRRALRSMGWRPVVDESRPNRVIAVSNESDTTRDTVIVEVKLGGELRVWVRTEIAGEHGSWIAPGTVCDDYSYAREREIADRITMAETRVRRRVSR